MPPNVVTIKHENGREFMTVQIGEHGLEAAEVHTSGNITDAQNILDTVSRALYDKPITLDELTKAIKERVKSVSIQNKSPKQA
jgi:Holliday junction resolvasome RuvABC ATP-dependent DNA helicase subunit